MAPQPAQGLTNPKTVRNITGQIPLRHTGRNLKIALIDTEFFSVPTVADIDGDGKIDLVFANL